LVAEETEAHEAIPIVFTSEPPWARRPANLAEP
jgi:hypothetical protein